MEERDEIEPRSRAEWRRWLSDHHDASKGVWLIWSTKRTGRQTITVEEGVLEALCFGWIDSAMRPRPEGKAALLFTPRRAGSTWSRVNKQRVDVLTAEGLMTEAGRAAVERAKRDGGWNALDAVEALQVPADLAAALAADPQADANFRAFAPSARKMALAWIGSAKRPATRAARITETADLAARNLTVASRARKRRRPDDLS